MIRTQVSFDEATYREARAEARRQRISFAELCRRAIARILAERDPDPPSDRVAEGAASWMRHAGVLDSEDEGLSERVDDVVYGRDDP